MGRNDAGRPPSGLRRAALVVVPTMAALGAGSVIAMAAIPAGDGTISGCYRNGSGSLRVVESTSQCSSLLDTPITWNQKGEKGEKGDVGPAGPPVAGGGTGAGGDAEIHLRLGGIEGGSTDQAHAGEIDVASFDLGVASTNSSQSGTGGGSGRTTFASFKIGKAYDTSSPALFNAIATGRHLPDAVVTFSRTTGAGVQAFLEYAFEDVVVDGYHQGGDVAPLLEDLSFSYRKVRISYTPPGQAAAIVTSWDVAKNAEG